MSIIIPANSASGGFEVDNSCRFNDGSSDYLNRTQTMGNRTTFTFSAWVKRSSFGEQNLITVGTSGTSRTQFHFQGQDALQFYNNDGGSVNMYIKTNRLFRDLSAWYHIVLRFDTTQSTASDRIRFYVNGEEETSLATNTIPSEDADNTQFNYNGIVADIGRRHYDATGYFDGYMAEVCFIDGQSLAPTSFGEFDEDSGIWKPKAVSGLTFGTNGFYLDFEDSSALGNDAVGSNNFTANNLAAIDQTTDTCTNNFATMNFLDNFWQGSAFSDGNTTVTTTNASQSYNTSSIMVSSGKWYVECKPVSGGSEPEIGIFSKLTGANAGNNSQLSYNANGYAYRASDPGSVWYNGSAVSTSFSQYANGDIVGIALDLDNNKLYFSKNGTFGNSGNPTSGSTGTGAISIVAPTSTTLGAYGFAANESFNDQNKVFSWNFGSPPYAISSGNTDGNGYGNFEYAVPSGYLSLCTANLSEVDS